MKNYVGIDFVDTRTLLRALKEVVILLTHKVFAVT